MWMEEENAINQLLQYHRCLCTWVWKININHGSKSDGCLCSFSLEKNKTTKIFGDSKEKNLGPITHQVPQCHEQCTPILWQGAAVPEEHRTEHSVSNATAPPAHGHRGPKMADREREPCPTSVGVRIGWKINVNTIKPAHSSESKIMYIYSWREDWTFFKGLIL